MQKITPCLWFNHNGEEAVKFYLSIFKEGKIISVTHNTESSPGKTGAVLTVEFELFGQRYVALNGGPDFPFTNAVSLMVACETQNEIDYYWDALLKGGHPEACGWLRDKYGVPWQIYPPMLLKMIRDPDPQKADRVMQAMMKMVKLDIAKLKEAYEGKAKAA